MQDDPPPKPNLSIQRLHGIRQSLLMLSLPQTTGDPSLRWLILDGRKLALSHGCGQISYRGIALAVKYLWDMGHTKLLVCVPEWMKTHEDLLHLDSPYLTKLQDNLFIFYMPSEAMGARHIGFMDAMSRKMDALIITQLGPDIWIEHRTRIVEFDFDRDDFILPAYQWGKKGPKLSRLFRLRKPKEILIQKPVTVFMLKWKRFLKRLRKPFDLSLSEKPESNLGLVIIDGSNVAMRHGFGTFYSCLGIYLAVQQFLRNGFSNITACVPYWIYNSRDTVYGYEYLHILYERGFLTLTPSEDDRPMLKQARDENGLIVTNDQFRNFKHQWKDVINNRIPYEFEGNHFIAFPNGAQAVDGSSVRPIAIGKGSA